MKEETINKVIVGAIIGLIGVLYFDTFSWLVNKWLNDPDYSHGFLIPIISGYIVWQKKEKLKEMALKPSNLGLLVIVFALLLEVMSVRADVRFSSGYSFIILLMGIALYWGGKEVFKELLFPIVFLVFMVPFLAFLIDPVSYKLKLLSSYLSVETVSLMGIPIHREGVIMSVPRGALEVADPCSGIRSLLSFLMVGTLFAYLSEGTMSKKIILLLVTIPLIIIGNSFRIIAAILLLHFNGIIISNTHWETALGVVVFLLVVSGLILTGRLLKCQISDIK